MAGFCGLSLNFGIATAAETATTSGTDAMKTGANPGYDIKGFTVESRWQLPTNVLVSLFSKYGGTNITLENIMRAASALDLEYIREGYPTMNIVVAPKPITDGIVTFGAFPGAVPQIVVAGHRFLISSNNLELALHWPVNAPVPPNETPVAAAGTTGPAKSPPSPRFTVYNYQIEGNSLLSPKFISMLLTNIPGAYGTNVSFDDIREVRNQLLAGYREQGYVAVAVDIPQQKLTNATVKLQVVEGRIDAINVTGNRYFSSNNVMRAMPGLDPNMMLNGLTFQAELNRANANQDRQISPLIEPGPDPGTSDLTLQVKDQPPFHGKVELNNDSSPGTPALRVNSSVVYDNLWQYEHALGLQYSFSPEQYKDGKEWNFYDLPSVANYSVFYRMPLGSPGGIDEAIAASPGSFGYSEATRKFNLPPASGQPDLTLFASRSTIDNGLSSTTKTLYSTNNSTLDEIQTHQDITINNDAGFRLNFPVAANNNVHMSLSGGLDFKTYASSSVGTNIYRLSSQIVDTLTGTPETNYNVSTQSTPIPATYNEVYYLPLALRYDVSWHDFLGSGTAGLGLSANFWESTLSQQTAYGTYIRTNHVTGKVTTNSTSITGIHGGKAFQAVAGSRQSSGRWVVITPSFTHTFELVTNWVTTFRADGQWTSEPLISNEQFGAGGINSVRGYQEGEVFGDTGWHVTLEQQTPPHVVGMIRGHIPVVIRGSIYTDYADVYLLDPQGRKDDVALWGVGCGCVASFGSFWQTRMLFSVPMLSTTTTTAYHPYFNFALTAQF